MRAPAKAPWLLLPLLAAAGCRSAAPAVEWPELGMRLLHYRGSPLRGPGTAPVPATEAELDGAWSMRCQVWRAARVLPSDLPWLNSSLRTVARPLEEDPVQAWTDLVPDARLDVTQAGADFVAGLTADGGVEKAHDFDLALVAGATATVEALTDAASFDSFGAAHRRGLGLHVHRTEADELVVALRILRTNGGVADGAVSDDLDADDDRPEMVVEMLVTDVRPALDGAPIVILVPEPIGDVQTTFVVVAWIERVPPDPDAFRAALERCRTDLATQYEVTFTPGARIPDADTPADTDRRTGKADTEPAAETPRKVGAYTPRTTPRATAAPSDARAATPAEEARRALALVARVAACELLAEVLRAAADEDVLSLVQAMEDYRADPKHAGSWALESAVLTFLANRGRDDELPLELEAVLLRRCGEVARYPLAIEALVVSSADKARFQRRVVETNVTFLDDSRPASRVRAFDWLAARGDAPAGYDPLGSRDERRAALDALVRRLREERSEPSARGLDNP